MNKLTNTELNLILIPRFVQNISIEIKIPSVIALISFFYHVTLCTYKTNNCLLLQNSTPMRHKCTHFVNVPHYGAKFFEFAVSLLSDKLKDRVMVRISAESFSYSIEYTFLFEIFECMLHLL